MIIPVWIISIIYLLFCVFTLMFVMDFFYKHIRIEYVKSKPIKMKFELKW